jgi:hypothetical protein
VEEELGCGVPAGFCRSRQDPHREIRVPTSYSWQDFYKAALLETDWTTMVELVHKAESEIHKRRRIISNLIYRLQSIGGHDAAPCEAEPVPSSQRTPGFSSSAACCRWAKRRRWRRPSSELYGDGFNDFQCSRLAQDGAKSRENAGTASDSRKWHVCPWSQKNVDV